VAIEDPGALGSLLALIAHDLRNPLSALNSNVGFLESTPDLPDSETKEALADVSASCSSMKHIIDNLELLGLSVQETSIKLERSPIVLWELVHEVLEELKPIAASYGARTEFKSARSSVPRVVVHREMMSRALGNLVFNSIQNGGTSAPILITVAAEGDQGVVRIVDRGPIVAEALRRTAFTAEGQLTCKGDPRGRYSRGLGLFAASVAAKLAGAEARSASPIAESNVFELGARLAS
jgi:signal transduction histidine kinase